jgi:hypothetical protein
MKTSELTGAALDWAVHQAWCEGACHDEPYPKYSTDWGQGGPIIERERIGIKPIYQGYDVLHWSAVQELGEGRRTGPTPLIAAMRCYCASKLGHEVEIPEELTP